MKIFFACVLICLGAYAENSEKEYSLSSSEGKVSFLAIGRPSALKIRGIGEGPKGQFIVGKDGRGSGTFYFQLDSLKTGIDLRDQHMKEKYLQTNQFSVAELTLKDMEFKTPVKQKVVWGTLKLRGKEKQIEVTVDVEDSSSEIRMRAKFPILLSDFSIDPPQYLGIKVAENVEVEVESRVAR